MFVENVQQQDRSEDCGPFTIAYAVVLSLNQDPVPVVTTEQTKRTKQKLRIVGPGKCIAYAAYQMMAETWKLVPSAKRSTITNNNNNNNNNNSNNKCYLARVISSA